MANVVCGIVLSIILIIIIIAVFADLHIGFKAKEYKEKQREDCDDSEVDYVKIYKDLGGNGFLIHYLNRCIEEKDTSDVPTTKNMIPKLTNCKNCGAPLHGNRCEFCDTEYDR